MNMKKLAAAIATVTVALASPAAFAAWTLNMTPGITAISRRVYDLHMIMYWWCVAIGIFVFGWMIYSLVRFRKSRGAVADAKLTHNTTAEIIWTIVPVIILIIMAVPATRTLIETDDASKSELTIRITGYQWKWGYQYVDSGVEVLSTLDRASNAARQLGSHIDPATVPDYLLNVDHPLVVPAGVKVRLLISAQDVIHSWWVPALAIKKDAIPGFVNEAWFKIDPDKTGLYRGQCAELCGRDHGFMPIVIDVRSKADFEAWLKTQQAMQRPADPAAPAVATAGTPAAPAAPAG
ncbi:MAG: cytochrome c oxidase subunit II [Gammaproteobacteria bacterium]|nr:cytochrome c oxidase subunit II [Gammaproteobacteria bacterium]MDE2251653.1 cytochrome c oxidase subunit II [Gammaproteobacteria bacterium]